MASSKHDDSTDIEETVAAFAKDLTAEVAKLTAAGKSDAKSEAEIKFSLNKNKINASRTPAEQAELLVKGTTKVCWSAHMADKARHVLCKIDGKVAMDAKPLQKALGSNFAAFQDKWAVVMKKRGLKNASGKDGWITWDPFHLELPESKVDRSDERAEACIEEYVRLTRAEDQPENASFEKNYAKLLKPYVAKYEKK